MTTVRERIKALEAEARKLRLEAEKESRADLLRVAKSMVGKVYKEGSNETYWKFTKVQRVDLGVKAHYYKISVIRGATIFSTGWWFTHQWNTRKKPGKEVRVDRIDKAFAEIEKTDALVKKLLKG